MFESWDDMRLLLALARAGSLGAAARELKVDPSTVGRRLTALEASMAVRLVTRTPEGVNLTAEGQAAVAAAEKMEEALGGLKRQLETRAEVGVVRLTTTEAFSQYLFRHLPDLWETHPALRVECITDSAALDLARGEADLAVRFARPQGDGMVVKKCGMIGWSLYGSDAYLARRGPVDLGHLEAHDVVAFDESMKGIPGAAWLAEHMRDAKVVLRCNSPRAITEAVGAGVGVSVIPCFVAGGNPQVRRLTPAVLASSEAWSAMHSDLKDVPRVRTVLDFIHGVFARDRAVLSGEP